MTPAPRTSSPFSVRNADWCGPAKARAPALLFALRHAGRACLLTVVLGLLGCVRIEGGAVELSWVTYCASGKRPGSTGASCSCTVRERDLAAVRLVLTPLRQGQDDAQTLEDGCSQGAICSFEASDRAGNTGFRVPPGEYEISVVPLDAQGTPLGGPSCVPDGNPLSCWQTPSPVRRTVVHGEVVSLGAVLIVVPDCPAVSGCRPSEGCSS